MEYQFIRDPISGFRVKISDEQALIGRWFNEELPQEKVLELLTACHALDKHTPQLQYQGKEIRFTLDTQEALFEAHNIFHQQDDLQRYADDFLELDEHGTVAACGFEDFVALLQDWSEFIGKSR